MSNVIRRGVLARVCIYCTAVADGNCNALLEPPPNRYPSRQDDINLAESLVLASEDDAAVARSARALVRIRQEQGQI